MKRFICILMSAMALLSCTKELPIIENFVEDHFSGEGHYYATGYTGVMHVYGLDKEKGTVNYVYYSAYPLNITTFPYQYAKMEEGIGSINIHTGVITFDKDIYYYEWKHEYDFKPEAPEEVRKEGWHAHKIVSAMLEVLDDRWGRSFHIRFDDAELCCGIHGWSGDLYVWYPDIVKNFE
ncbi:MAG: hypothetical protein MJZ07_07930 [Bacteroidales bacterium]|nr:hypothetical protein [Bacteroidales bacterium]